MRSAFSQLKQDTTQILTFDNISYCYSAYKHLDSATYNHFFFYYTEEFTII